jgi:hypothetical protein
VASTRILRARIPLLIPRNRFMSHLDPAAWPFDMQERRFIAFYFLAAYTGKAENHVTCHLKLPFHCS